MSSFDFLLRRKKLGRTLLIAAVIVSIFAALCVGAYALNIFGIRELLLPGGYVERYQEGAVLVDTQALSIQGIESSREFMAYKEFKSFYDDYTAKDYYGDQVPQKQDGTRRWKNTARPISAIPAP